MKRKLVRKHLAKSLATPKSRIKKLCIGIKSIGPRNCEMIIYHIFAKVTPQPSIEPHNMASKNYNLVPEDPADTVGIIFCFAALVAKHKLNVVHRCQ